MHNIEAPYHLDAVAGGLLLAFLVYAKIGQLRFRKNAVEVPATVIKVIAHPRVRCHFVRYRWGDEERTAEFRTSSVRSTFGLGDTVKILVDPTSPPNDVVPEDGAYTHENTIGGESAVLAGDGPVYIWELVYAVMGAATIYYSFR